VYCNGTTDRAAFDAKLEFDVRVLPYEGDDAWIPGILRAMKVCLDSDEPPVAGAECEHCTYCEARGMI
jgi:hypothetical protein